MTPRIFASLHPFLEGGPINGRKQANAGFLAALLALDPFDQYHFYVANPADLRQRAEELGPLPAVRRHALHAFHRAELPAALAADPWHVCHLSDPINDFVTACALRNRMAPEIFPVTSVNHTISYASYAPAFRAHLWPGCSPRDAIGCNSGAAREALRGWFAHLGASAACPGPRLEVIPMGMRPRVPGDDAARRTAMRANLGLEEHSVLLLLFGRIALEDKLDPHPLCMALRRVCEARPELDVRLVISGFTHEGDKSPEFLQALARLLRIPVQVLPNPAPDEKESLFAAADIFVSPSDNIQETFGLTLVEAAAAGLPVIASDWDGYRDIVAHGETGLLIPTLAPDDTPALDMLAQALFDNQHHFIRGQYTAVHVPALADAITRLAEDTPLRRRMGEAARAHACAHFTWESVVRRWLALWEELRAVPLAAAQEEALRRTRHELHVPFGKVFSSFATSSPADDLSLVCTGTGHAVRERRLPWAAAGKLPPGLTEERVHQLLVLARRPVTLSYLRQRTDLPAEILLCAVLWALKHDLLECPLPSA